MTPKIQLGTTPSLGIGRKDYSQAVEASVETLISSYQDEYSDWDYVFVPAGADATKIFTIPTGKVVVAYDFFAQITQHSLISLNVEAFRNFPVPAIYTVFTTEKVGSISEQILKGVPFYSATATFNLHNYAAEDLWFYVGFAGIILDSSRYFET